MKIVVQLIIATLLLILSGCGGNTITKPEVKERKPDTPAKSSTSNSAASDKKPNQGGGYYLDDGPDETPINVDSVPDAKPKVEPLLARANKPYAALGQKYQPMTTYKPYKKQGIASWYGKRFHGKKTSSGEVYDMYAMSAAHTVLPIPSYARVTNPANGASVIVRINDRGPFKHNRLIDLSYAAAYKLNLINAGSGLVEVETINPYERSNVESNVMSDATVSQALTSSQFNMNDLREKANQITTQYYVQVGVFKSEANANLLQKKVQALLLDENVAVASVYNNGMHRVKIGPYQSKSDADISANNIRKQFNLSAIIVNQ